MIKIAVLGYGTVGSGVVEVIQTNQELINKRVGEELEIKYVLDLRDFPGSPAEHLIVHDFEQIVNDEEVKIVVEVMGGTGVAYEFTKANGKKVVINGFGKIMIPVDADEIIPATNQRKNSTILAFVNNNKVYFCIRGEKIYPTNGIPRENVVGYGILTEEEVAFQSLLIGIKINNKVYKVYYIPRANNIPNIQTTDNVEVTDEVERNNIEKLFFPEKIQISEQFRDLINRMDIL